MDEWFHAVSLDLGARRYEMDGADQDSKEGSSLLPLLATYTVSSFLFRAVERLVSCMQYLLGLALCVLACRDTDAYCYIDAVFSGI